MLYESHLRAGLAAQALLVPLVAFSSHYIGSTTLLLSAVGLALPFTLLGAVLPDIDEPQSIVYRWFRPFISACTALYVFVLLYASRKSMIRVTQKYLQTPSAGYVAGIVTICLVASASILMYRLLQRLLKKLPHRGLCHQLPTGFVTGMILYAEFVPFLTAVGVPRPPMIAAVFILAFLVGFVAHLAVDGLLLRQRTYTGRKLEKKF